MTREGHDVTIFDINDSPYLISNQRMIKGNILDYSLVDKVVGDNDIVYNFAALADIDESHNKPFETIERNILGNSVILDACMNHKIKRYIFASTIYVYSDTGSFYRISKRASEMIIKNYHKEYNLPYTILRYGSLYGLRSQTNNFIYKTLKDALENKKIIREGDGEEIREYIHVKDASVLSVDILDKKYENKTINITGNEAIKIKELFDIIKEILDLDLKIKYIETKSSHHYGITPYKLSSFMPELGKKLTSNYTHDFEQGLIEILLHIREEND